ncbi:unnamed protein product [Spirodela intermedia]|uniref:Uncharacterized protein n=1 Tax=Spirodela intermedia TaxID=51605 RepID=A0A7I8IE33_SPIIN|nr:unnamed protein product [Spirodela intermedia]CAA6655645.1 unnamed protein product [Spirodela intermedia]
MIVKGIQAEPEENREVETTKEEEVDVDDKTVEESARDPSSTISDSSCQSSLAKPSPVPGYIFLIRIRGPARRSTKGGWTEEEDEILARAVKQFKGKNWKKIAEFFPGRSDVQCLHRWQKVLDPELVKGAWTKEEDECIIKLVNKYGAKKWATIANKMTGRIGKQCRERWHNHLNPAIKKCAWTTEEEIVLIRAHGMYGNKWAEIAKLLPGRADNSIKNHWNCSVKKKLDSYLSSGLLDPSNKNGALDLNSGSSVRGHPHDLATQKGSMELDENSTTVAAFKASFTSFPRENESSRKPREDSDYCITVAQPVSMEISRSSRGLPVTSPTGRCSTYPSSGEDSSRATAQNYETNLCCKDDYPDRTTADPIMPTTTQPKPHAQMAIHRLTKELFASPEKLERHAKSIDAPGTSSKLSEQSTPPILEKTPMDIEKDADFSETPCTPVPVDMEVLDHDRYALLSRVVCIKT